MLIVLTSEKEIANEASLINELFEAGLERLHLRKPQFTVDEYRHLLDQIESKYYKKIMLHEHHALVDEYKLRGIHLQEKARKDLENTVSTFVKDCKEIGYRVSSSFHTIEDIQRNTGLFEYVLLSPVFNSISKSGYQGKNFDVSHLDEFVVGMGGINGDNLQTTFDLGYKGVGILGGVWNTESPIKSFKGIKDKIENLSLCKVRV